MQTFLPYTNFIKVARTLDPKRLGKQRVEAKQILDILEGRNPDSRWRHHVAVRMWKGYEQALRSYYNTMIIVWEHKGNKNNMPILPVNNVVYPPWLYDKRLPLSHRGNLLRKNPEYYGEFEWKDADPTAPYFWPVPLKDKKKQEIMVSYWGEN